MSLLPNQIQPPSQPIGTLMIEGKPVQVMIDKNWWLFLYNLAAKVLGVQGTPGLPADAVALIAAIDSDAVDSDAVSLRRPIDNLNVMLQDLIPADPNTISPTAPLLLTEESVPMGSLPATNGGTGQTQYVLGDTLYSGSANNLARLAGNIATTRKFLVQAGTGSVSAAPIWDVIGSGDLPGGLTGFANPSASVGLSAVNGTATTAMRSDAAPPLSQSIAPTMSGAWAFTASAAAATSYPTSWQGTQPTVAWKSTGGAVDAKWWEMLTDATTWRLRLINDAGNSATNVMIVTRSGMTVTGTVLTGPIGVNGNSAPSQVTGWGTPTGAAVVANFPGATATLVQCSNVIAKLITDLKAFGLYGA